MCAEIEGCRFNVQTDGRLVNPAYDGMVSLLTLITDNRLTTFEHH